MRVVVVGLGVQGQKRRAVAGAELAATVDPVHPEAGYRRIEDVPVAAYDAALVCTPDEPKLAILDHLASHGKHALVEKPLIAATDAAIAALRDRARARSAVLYTAYNHRFEPHFMRMRELIESGKLGRLYRLRLFYGNGTARLVRDSAWRDTGAGVLPDLGSHLLDTILFWLGAPPSSPFRVVSADRFENRAFDHVVLRSPGPPTIELEMTLCSWRNHFTCDLFAEKGSAHIESLCKWGPTTFTVRERRLPSGRPDERAETLVQPDPTWVAEYAHFKALCAAGGPDNLDNDLWINGALRNLAAEALAS
ncbi:MAG: Gfo/Idh/MocA family protein [Pseudomonadota bacterium]